MTNRDPKIEKIETLLDKLGNTAVESFHYVALFIIGCMVIWSAGHTVYEILTVKQYASIDDILLLFIYLELGAMVGIYFKTNHMPVPQSRYGFSHYHRLNINYGSCHSGGPLCVMELSFGDSG